MVGMMKDKEMLCPVCKKPLRVDRGGSMDAYDGFTVSCATPYGNGPDQCHAQEVAGHGKTIKDAFEVVTEKFRFALNK